MTRQDEAKRIRESMKRFHAHLDVCKQCRDNPFALCKPGEALLLATSEEDVLIGVRRILGGAPSGGEQ